MRIFWLGMHKLLVRTELPRLRELGFEVFNPPYLSPVADQSAELNWDAAQATTLPRDVFEALSRYNFFYNPIDEAMAAMLNEHFDAVIVTINPDWLTEILKVFRNKIIYRTYGQTYPLSDYLWNNRAARLILEHPDFCFVPFHELTADREHSWLRQRMAVVPYHLSDDIIAAKDSWRLESKKSGQIMLTCPNIDNPYYAEHYRFLKASFPEEHFRLFGVQMRPVDDPQIVGSLPRSDYIRAYRQSSGYLYSYGEPLVSYLPPIEMMIVGGPVIYLPHSLLARFFGSKAPGLARNPDEAKALCQRLRDNDRGFAREVIASQKEVRKLYHPDHVNPVFDATMRRLLAPAAGNDAPRLLVGAESRSVTTTAVRKPKRAYLLFHFPGGIVGRRDEAYFSAEGIPRVMRQIARAIIETTDLELVVTTSEANAQLTMGYFDFGADGRAKIFVTDASADGGVRHDPERWARRLRYFRSPLSRDQKMHLLRRLRLLRGPPGAYSFLGVPVARIEAYDSSRSWRRVPFAALASAGDGMLAAVRFGLNAAERLRRSRMATSVRGRVAQHGVANAVSKQINDDEHCVAVFVPHYYLFPEATNIDKPQALYLPDYTPHFFQGTAAFEAEERFAGIGRAVAAKARVAMANSQFTKSYISETILAVPQEKMRVFPLPNLNVGNPEQNTGALSLVCNHVQVYAGDRPILFYPTQNRPNKNLAFLMEVMAELAAGKVRHGAQDGPAPVLVLTCNLDDYPPVRQAFDRLALGPHVVFAHGASDHDLQWIYKKAACVVLTTTMEGNFPPQILEALAYDTPVVAGRIPLITEELGDYAERLLLARTNDRDDFVSKIRQALEKPAAARARQKQAYDVLMAARTPEKFNQAVRSILAELSGASL
jgi:glycosyltransferase involved in cell wall biosynthesis